jgi:hypothetical protein
MYQTTVNLHDFTGARIGVADATDLSQKSRQISTNMEALLRDAIKCMEE